jgi:hypothetical protein
MSPGKRAAKGEGNTDEDQKESAKDVRVVYLNGSHSQSRISPIL